LIAFGLCLLQISVDIVRGGPRARPFWIFDAFLLGVPLLGAAVASIPNSKLPIRPLTYLADLAFTVSIVGFLFLPSRDVSAVTVAVCLKLLATAVLLPLPPRHQNHSTLLTLAIYAVGMWIAGREITQTHQIVGPVLAGLLAGYGSRRLDQTHRKLSARGIELEASERRLRSALDKERILLSVAEETTVLTDLRSALARLNRATAEATRASFSTTLLIHADEDYVELASAYSDQAERTQAPGTKFPNWSGSRLQRAMTTGETFALADNHDQDIVPSELLEAVGVKVLAFSPIVNQGKLLGILVSGRQVDETPFDQRETSILAGIAAHAAVTITNAQLYENLATSESAYRDLFERANDLIFVADDQEGIHFANQAALRFFDIDTEALAGTRWSQFLPPDEVSKMSRRAGITRRRHFVGTDPFEVRVDTPDGEATLELRARRISAPNQTPELYQCIARDVTERRRRDQETQALLMRLQESQRLQDEFVANMSHELRTPLNVIIGYTDLIADDLEMPINSDARSFLDRIGAASRALHRMVESILEYARLDRGRMMLIPTNFSSEHLLLEIQGLCNDVRSSLDVALELSQEENIELATDYDRLYSVLSNLMLNALKFTPKGKVSLALRREGPHAVFRVRDTGIGIEPAEMRSVFEPFRQVDGSDTRTFGGVGLGLAIVRRNVDLLQGTIDVDSTPDYGTTFTVKIPVQMMGTQPSQRQASSAA